MGRQARQKTEDSLAQQIDSRLGELILFPLETISACDACLLYASHGDAVTEAPFGHIHAQ
jgi:hypothetical protein